MFARLIAIRPPAYQQVIECVPNASTPARIAQNLANRVDALVLDKKVAAAALLFPSLTTLEATARVMLALASQPGWTVTPTALDNEVVGKLVAISVVRQIPFGAKSCPSETLVLGPFSDFPPTRRAPVTAMELFVGDPLEFDPKTGAPTKQANLAHIDAKKILGQASYDEVWTKSETGREASLGTKDDNRAKAKVAFVIPVALARRLECAA